MIFKFLVWRIWYMQIKWGEERKKRLHGPYLDLGPDLTRDLKALRPRDFRNAPWKRFGIHYCDLTKYEVTWCEFMPRIWWGDASWSHVILMRSWWDLMWFDAILMWFDGIWCDLVRSWCVWCDLIRFWRVSEISPRDRVKAREGLPRKQCQSRFPPESAAWPCLGTAESAKLRSFGRLSLHKGTEVWKTAFLSDFESS